MDAKGSSSRLRRPWENGDGAGKRTCYWPESSPDDKREEIEEEADSEYERHESDGQDHEGATSNSEDDDKEEDEEEEDGDEEKPILGMIVVKATARIARKKCNPDRYRPFYLEGTAIMQWRIGRSSNHITEEAGEEINCGDGVGSICYLPLKPPIFQCDVGHVVCSACRGKLMETTVASDRCHVCRAQTTRGGGYRRCHAMEQLVDSIRVPCPHAAHGCETKPAYHDREAHARSCAHKPCRCPGKACSFVGSAALLQDHLVAQHEWPCTAEVSAAAAFDVNLRDGFNFLAAVRGQNRYLFLLNVARAPFGRAVSAVRISPHAAAVSSSPATVCELQLSYTYCRNSSDDDDLRRRVHCQTSQFNVGSCTGRSDGGLPDPNVSFQFAVLKDVPGHDAPLVKVKASVNIS
ncbi:hypothetical protein QOZ80_5AG0404510 [Eleusine coracana subsp. coracana]|nr:hypothetical protein QOZ80_5AG0404510 [Eleusine coracana subsp. coracana]